MKVGHQRHTFFESSLLLLTMLHANILFEMTGVFICRGKEDALVTKNMVIGESVYGEKRISVEVSM